MKKCLPAALGLCLILLSCKKDFVTSQVADSSSVTDLSLDDEGLVYIGGMRDGDIDSGKLCAIDAVSGVLKWKYSVYNGYFTASPCIANGIVYAQTNFPDLSLSALDAYTGNLLWRKVYAGPNDFSTDISPCYLNNTVYLTCGNTLLAVDAADGKLKWRYRTRGTGLNRFASPVAMYERIYINDKSSLYAINAGTGEPVWQKAIDIPYRTAPAVKNGMIFINSQEGTTAIDTSGNIKWVNPETGYSLFATAVKSSTLYSMSYFYTPGAALHALNQNNGAAYWSHALSQVPRGDVFVASNALYINLQDSLEALDIATGSRKWILYTGTTGEYTSFSSPVASNSLVYTYGKNDSLYAVNKKTGKKAWAYFVNGGVPPSSSPVLLINSGEAVYPSSSGMRQ